MFLDGALAVDRRRVFKWYFENLNGSTKLADRFRQAALDVSHGFIFAYRAGSRPLRRAATIGGGEPASQGSPPASFAFTAPTTWCACFAANGRSPPRGSSFTRCSCGRDQRFERSIPLLPGEDPLAIQGTVEQEYLHALLIEQLDTGNLTPAELDWASSRLLAWSKHLQLDTEPPEAGSFYVDLAGAAAWHASTAQPKG